MSAYYARSATITVTKDEAGDQVQFKRNGSSASRTFEGCTVIDGVLDANMAAQKSLGLATALGAGSPQSLLLEYTGINVSLLITNAAGVQELQLQSGSSSSDLSEAFVLLEGLHAVTDIALWNKDAAVECSYTLALLGAEIDPTPTDVP